MARETTVRGAARILVVVALLLGPRVAAADDAQAAGDRVVPPSTYVEGIETPGKTGGSDNETDAAAAQAAAATAAAPASPAEHEQSTGQRTATIAADLLIGRPTALVATVAGSALFAISLPLTAASGTYAEARERLVEEPGNRLIGPLGK